MAIRTVFADERGRITLGTKLLGRYGKKFAVAAAGNEIVLVPIAKDPVKELGKLGKQAKVDSYTLKQLKKMAREEAEKDVRRH